MQVGVRQAHLKRMHIMHTTDGKCAWCMFTLVIRTGLFLPVGIYETQNFRQISTEQSL